MKTDDRKRLADLAKSFPVLAEAPGLSPFDSQAFMRWRDSNDCIGGAFFAAEFILQVGGYSHGFDVVTAMATWPAECKLAFLAWAADPWTMRRDR